jgi:hypothetical protein
MVIRAHAEQMSIRVNLADSGRRYRCRNWGPLTKNICLVTLDEAMSRIVTKDDSL